jgi:hypothetical protein
MSIEETPAYLAREDRKRRARRSHDQARATVGGLEHLVAAERRRKELLGEWKAKRPCPCGRECLVWTP